jgi:hypothetical protein
VQELRAARQRQSVGPQLEQARVRALGLGELAAVEEHVAEQRVVERRAAASASR